MSDAAFTFGNAWAAAHLYKTVLILCFLLHYVPKVNLTHVMYTTYNIFYVMSTYDE